LRPWSKEEGQDSAGAHLEKGFEDVGARLNHGYHVHVSSTAGKFRSRPSDTFPPFAFTTLKASGPRIRLLKTDTTERNGNGRKHTFSDDNGLIQVVKKGILLPFHGSHVKQLLRGRASERVPPILKHNRKPDPPIRRHVLSYVAISSTIWPYILCPFLA
jgi:hypothetical protein